MFMSTIYSDLFNVLPTSCLTMILHFNYKLSRFCFNYFNAILFIFT